MKLYRIALTIGFIAASVAVVLSQDIEEYDYEDDGAAAPPAPPQRGRLPILSSRQAGKSPLLGHKPGKPAVGGKGAAAAKAAPPPPPPQEPEEEEVEEYDEGAEEPVEVTSTEAPKKTVGPIVRPFRSNDDLLAALKRRRQQQAGGSGSGDRTTSAPTTTTAAAPVASKKSSGSFGGSGRRSGRNGGRGQVQVQAQDEYVEAPEPVKKGPQSRKYNGKAGARSAPAPVLEDVPVEDQPKPKFGRGSRRS